MAYNNSTQPNDIERTVMTDEEISQSIRTISDTFTDALQAATTKSQSVDQITPDTLRKFQIEFAYIINELKSSPAYRSMKHTQDANELIVKLKKLSA